MVTNNFDSYICLTNDFLLWRLIIQHLQTLNYFLSDMLLICLSHAATAST